MKMILAALIFIITGTQLSSCKTGGSTGGGKITVDEFEQKINSEKNPLLIDVRTPEEYSEGYIKGSQNIDWNGDSFDNKVSSLDKDRDVFVYCLSGGRSSAAADHLKKLGFKNVFDLAGGMMAWNNAGKPVVTTSLTKNNDGMSIEEFNQKISSSELILVDFNAPWCAPCKKMAPMLEELSIEKKDKFTLLTINIDENKELAKILKITELPVLILYKHGQSVYNKTGLTEKKELLDVISKN